MKNKFIKISKLKKDVIAYYNINKYAKNQEMRYARVILLENPVYHQSIIKDINGSRDRHTAECIFPDKSGHCYGNGLIWRINVDELISLK